MAAGPIGTGKTEGFCTLPGRKFAYVFDTSALPTLRGADVEFLDFIADTQDIGRSLQPVKTGARADKPKSGIEPTTYIEWDDDLQQRADSGFFDDYDWLGLDSFTSWEEIMMDRVLYLAGRAGKWPQQDDYMPVMKATRDALRSLMSLPCNLYITAHTDIAKDEVTGKIHGQLLITGKNRIRVPQKFTNIFAFGSEEANGKAKFTVRTVADRLNPTVRCSIKGLNAVEDVTIDWKKPLEGQGIGRFFV